RARWRWRADSPPPCPASATRARRSCTSSRIVAALAAKSAERVSMSERRGFMCVPHRHGRSWVAHPRLRSGGERKAWMAGPGPAMTAGAHVDSASRRLAEQLAADQHAADFAGPGTDLVQL